MLWPDLEVRKKELKQLSLFFKEDGYIETSNKIIELIKYLYEESLPDDFQKKWVEVVTTFRDEFVCKDPYKKECFQTIEDIMVSVLLEQKDKLYNKLLAIFSIFRSMREPSIHFRSIAKIFHKLDERERFYGLCFLYLINVEGIFDEWIRILYYLKKLSLGQTVTLTDIYEKKIWDIRNEFMQIDVSDVLFNAWEDNHVRNSIGHTRFSYNTNSKMMTFVDVHPRTKVETYRESFNYQEFKQLCDRIFVISEIPERLFMMFRIRDMFTSTKPFN